MADTSALLDVEGYGRRLRAARLVRDMTAENVVDQLGELGHKITVRTLHAYERGDWMVPLDVAMALAVVLAPEHGVRYFAAALKSPLRERWVEVFGNGNG